MCSNNDDKEMKKNDENDENDENDKRKKEEEHKLRIKQSQRRAQMNIIDDQNISEDKENLIFLNDEIAEKEREKNEIYLEKKRLLPKKIYIGKWEMKDSNKRSLLLRKMYTIEYKQSKQIIMKQEPPKEHTKKRIKERIKNNKRQQEYNAKI